MYMCVFVFFFKQKTAYEMRISDWSSDVCSSDVVEQHQARRAHADPLVGRLHELPGERRPEGGRRIGDDLLRRSQIEEIGRARVVAAPRRNVVRIGNSDVVARHHEIGRASCRERVWTYV